MRNLTLAPANRSARNAASIARADEGPGAASIRLYDAEGGALLAVRQLAKPCGAVRESDGRIVLAPSSANDDVVLASGAAAWGEWIAADGVLLAAGPVTDVEGNVSGAGGAITPTGDVGPWVLTGTAGTLLYEGGLVLLKTGVIG